MDDNLVSVVLRDTLTKGERSLVDAILDVRVDVPLDDATFDPAQYATFTPWYRR